MNKQFNLTEGFNPEKIRRSTTWRALMSGVLAMLLVVVAFIAILYFFPLITGLPDTYQLGKSSRQINWGLLGDITSLATFSLFFGGVVFAFADYVQNAVQKKREDAEASFSIYKEMYNKLMNPEAMEARRWVIVNLPTLEDMGNDKKAWLDRINTELNKVPRGWKGKRSPGKEYLKDILNTFDFIGFVAKHYWSMENELVMWMSPSIAKVWERIAEYVEEEAKQRNEPDYYESARQFGDYCVEWRRNNRPKSIVIKNGT
jgi:ABC-type multidrug transport system fused ATPase/permease subunit